MKHPTRNDAVFVVGTDVQQAIRSLVVDPHMYWPLVGGTEHASVVPHGKKCPMRLYDQVRNVLKAALEKPIGSTQGGVFVQKTNLKRARGKWY